MRRLLLLAATLLTLAIPATAQLWNAARSSFAVKIAETVFDNSGNPWPFFSTVNAENYDQGGQGIGYNAVASVNCATNATSYRPDYINFVTSTDGPQYQLGCSAPGDWHKYTVNISQAGPYVITLRQASADTSGGPTYTFLVDGTSVGTVAALNTGSYTTFGTLQSPQFNATLGNHVIEILLGGGCCAGDISSFQGSQASAVATVPAGAKSANFTQLAFDAEFSHPFYSNPANWLVGCGANPTSPGPSAGGIGTGNMYWFKGWPGFANNTANWSCNDVAQVQDPVTHDTVLAYTATDAESGNCGDNNPGHPCPIPFLLMSTANTASDCSANGSFCSNHAFYAEIEARIPGPFNQPCNQGICYDFWFVGDPEVDGIETNNNFSGLVGQIHNFNVGFPDDTGSGVYDGNFTSPSADFTQYFKFAWRYGRTSDSLADSNCGNGVTADTSNSFVSAYIGNTTGDPPKFTNPIKARVCVNATQQNGSRAYAFSLSNNENAAVNGTRVIYIRRFRVWTCPGWSPTNMTPSGCISPSFDP